ncbi:MAG TPA: tail fiber domain-containing protein, partial [Chthoniobacterales bacterium]
TAVGPYALLLNTVGVGNTAVGGYAFRNATGSYNTGVGDGALYKASGGSNSALGTSALGANTSGTGNVGVGFDALVHNRLGNDNTAIGSTGGGLTLGSGNVYIGPDTTAYADDESDTTRISNIYSSVATTRAVYIDGDNKIGTLSSSRRYKDEIKPMDQASETLYSLKPVTFRYKKEVDRSRALSFGLIAEEVAEVDPDLITRDKEGQPQTVRYEAVNAMLLNEFLKEHAKVQQLEASVDALARQIKEQKAKIEKVSVQLATGRSVSQVALTNP